jgi:hypothetical protein
MANKFDIEKSVEDDLKKIPGAPEVDTETAIEPKVASPLDSVNPQQYNMLYQEQNINNWILRGSALSIGGNLANASGLQLGIGTNAVQGYGNGQMLATAAGNGTGNYAGLVAGTLVNWDPASTDTGQKVWNYKVISDPSIKLFLQPKTTYPGTLLCAAPKMAPGWILLAQYLYGPGTAATDASIVATALAAAATANVVTLGQVMAPNNSYVQTVAY